MDYPGGFSLYEQRQLAELERELSADRRLADMMAVLGSPKTRAWRRMRCWGVRVRRPGAALRGASRLAKIGVLIALALSVLVPALLVVALGLGWSVVAMVAVCVLPVPPVLMAIAYHRATHSA